MKGKLTIGSLGVSLLLHTAVFLTIGGWVLIQAVAPKLTPAGVAHADEQPQTEQPPELPDDQPAEPAADTEPDPSPSAPANTSAAEMIVSAAPAVTLSAPPALAIMPDTPAAARPADSDSSRVRNSLAGKVTVGNLFGATIESGQLGVILDISGSGHQYLQAVISEIEKNFPDAYIVLVFGCGMSDGVTEEQVQILDFARAKVDPQRDAAGARSILNQIILAQKSPDMVKLVKHLKSRPNVWYIYGGDIGPAQHAFTFLLKKNADTIYWFSDFEDQINKGWAQKLPRAIKAKNVRIIAHNFTGSDSPQLQAMPFARELVTLSGGKLIIATPKTR